MIPAIENRRSIRKFSTKPIPQEDITEIIESGLKAPSAKNRQPWKFVVLQGESKEEMLETFRRGVAREESGNALLPDSTQHMMATKYTIQILEQAPVVIFVVNTLGKGIFAELTNEERVYEICNLQSISASIQNMLLAATDKGIGSLWVCDIYFAYQELAEWLNEEGELIAAVALGYPEEAPKARPRKNFDDVVIWKRN